MPQTKTALKFIILLGIVSLCADATYEGARSITGAYLGFLGASGTVVGLVAGLGELIGYGLSKRSHSKILGYRHTRLLHQYSRCSPPIPNRKLGSWVVPLRKG